ncbi:Mu transposase domain-containing protein [Gordonia sp. NPDC003424]
MLIDPARAFKPKDKARVERPMPYIRDSFFRGREFDSVAQMQQAAIEWCLQVYGRHSHRGIDGMMPVTLFEQAERDVLKPLPPRRFELVTYHVGKVAPDCHVKAGKALYSVPWRLIGEQVRVRTCGDVVQVFADEEVVATHVLHLSDFSTNLEHYPPHTVAFASRPARWCRTQAEQIGEHAVAVVDELCEVNAIHRLRSIQSILGLRKKYPDDRINAACARAIAVGDVGARTIKGILVAGTEHDGAPEPAAPTTPACLRGPQAFADDGLDPAIGQ